MSKKYLLAMLVAGSALLGAGYVLGQRVVPTLPTRRIPPPIESQEQQLQRRAAERAETIAIAKKLICNDMLEPGERATIEVVRYRDRLDVSASYRDANGKSRYSGPILP
jgi:hypothetical protein